MRITFFILLCLFSFFGCKVSELNIVGKYYDKINDDTLTLMTDNKYEFEERLKNGEHGWNTGQWAFTNNRISLYNTNPLPVVGYKLRFHKIGVGPDSLKLAFTIDQSKKDISFTEVNLKNKGASISDAVKIVKNKIAINTTNYDSLRVKISYFPIMVLNKNKFDINGIYEIIIYPAERLYELDKMVYKYRNGVLQNRNELIRFKKINSTLN